MNATTFDFDALFDADYLYFYEPLLTLERTGHEVELIWRLLSLETGMTVLDLACGHGRIANSLAKRGCQVTGLDATALFLEKARRDAETSGVEVEYILGDMRILPWNERFDCVVNWFTAFGYFDDDQNRQVLAQAYRALKPGGKLLIEIQNLSRILRQFRSEVVTERDRNYMIDRNQFDVITNRIYTERIIIRDGQIRRAQFFVRLFSFVEIRDWLLQAGFTQIQAYGYDGEPLALDSRRMIVLATK